MYFMGCQSWSPQNQTQNVCWHSGTLWALFCSVGQLLGVGRRVYVAGQGVNDAHCDRVATEGS